MSTPLIDSFCIALSKCSSRDVIILYSSLKNNNKYYFYRSAKGKQKYIFLVLYTQYMEWWRAWLVSDASHVEWSHAKMTSVVHNASQDTRLLSHTRTSNIVKRVFCYRREAITLRWKNTSKYALRNYWPFHRKKDNILYSRFFHTTSNFKRIFNTQFRILSNF